MKSKSIWNASSPLGVNDVERPRGVTKSVEFHQWFMSGVSAKRIFPTTCVHMWIECSVSFRSASATEAICLECGRSKPSQLILDAVTPKCVRRT